MMTTTKCDSYYIYIYADIVEFYLNEKLLNYNY